MKKTALLTVLSVFFCAESYAQDTKMSTMPAYDNVNKEKEWNLHKIPTDNDKYALMERPDNAKAGNYLIPMPINRVNLLDPNMYKTNRELTRYDIKKVTFPKKEK